MKRLLELFLPKKTVKETINADEHFVPVFGLDLEQYIKKGDLSGVHHLIRYIWALKVIPDLSVKNILDIACGAGYGSYLIAKEFPSVYIVGADYDQRAIENASKNYSLPNLEYKYGDGIRWDETIGNTVFDCVISFDTIEHVSHREIMMKSLVQHLNKSSSLLLFTPLVGSITSNLHPDWKYHKIEYSAASLYDFLKRYFNTIMRPDDNTLPHLDVFDRLNKNSSICYFLKMNPVLCKNPIIIENSYKP